MNKSKIVPVFIFLFPFILFFAGCGGEMGEVTMEEFLLDELWNMEIDALTTVNRLNESGGHELPKNLVYDKSREMMNEVKEKLNKYSKAGENIKELFKAQTAYYEYFITTVSDMEKGEDSYLNNIDIEWEKLNDNRNAHALEIIKGIDINNDNKRDFIEKYLENLYMNDICSFLTYQVLNELPANPDSIPLFYTYAVLMHYEWSEKKEYNALLKLKESSGLSTRIQDWILKRLHYLELYEHCGTPDFWTEKNIAMQII